MKRIIALASLCTACPLPPVDAGETLDGSSSGSSSASADDDETTGSGTASTADGGSSSSSVDTGDTSDGGSTDDGAPICTPNDGFACEAPVDCVDFAECGLLLSLFDEHGCGRPRCSAETQCEDGSVCFRPNADWGECVGSGPCEQEGDVCDCFIQLDCGGEYCLPADVAPPAACLTIDDPTECAAAGCDVVTALGVSADGLSCTCETAEVCVWLGDSTSSESPTAYIHGISGEFFLVPSLYDPVPLGLSECSDPNCPCIQECGG